MRIEFEFGEPSAVVCLAQRAKYTRNPFVNSLLIRIAKFGNISQSELRTNFGGNSPYEKLTNSLIEPTANFAGSSIPEIR